MTARRDVRTEGESDIELAASFPASFIWGAATSAYQIEGATHDDGRGPSIWDRFSTVPGTIYNGDTGDVAVDHYHLMDQDVDLIARLGLTAYRFSIAWPRILPDGMGNVNERGLDFYDRLVDRLLDRGIMPVVTLYHWDLPQALEDEGGWLNRATSLAFARYADLVSRRLGDRVRYWITLNEPWCSAYLGYGTGVHAPGTRRIEAAVTAGHHLLLAHGWAVQRMRAQCRPDAHIGITLNLTPVYAADGHPQTLRAQREAHNLHNRWFLDPLFREAYPAELFASLSVSLPPIADGDLADIATPIDFLGVNYYSRLLVGGDNRHKSDGGSVRPDADSRLVDPMPAPMHTDMGWEIYPEGLADLLLSLHREYGPRAIAITENGAAFDDMWSGGDQVEDNRRVQYLREHVQALAVARLLGVPVVGYFAWSLLDNFEWAEGYRRRFGMVYVDYPTQRRIIKDSGRWYAGLCAAHRALQRGVDDITTARSDWM
jgi:beta-glucosidase